MKKLLKVLLIIGVIILLTVVSKSQNAPKNYWEDTVTDGAIEAKYNSLGAYTVVKKTYDAPKDEQDSNSNHFVVWYPEQEGKYPLVVMVNGSGTPCMRQYLNILPLGVMLSLAAITAQAGTENTQVKRLISL